VRKELPAIQADIPEGMQITLLYDSTEAISASIVEVFKTIGEAAAIVVIIIFLFLGSFRAVVIPIVTIPLVADRRLLPDVGDRLFAEYADPPRHGARHRPWSSTTPSSWSRTSIVHLEEGYTAALGGDPRPCAS